MYGLIYGNREGPSNFSHVEIVKSKIRWFKICAEKLSAAIRLKVTSNLFLKILSFKADILGENQLKYNDGHKKPLLDSQIEES